MSTKRRWFRWSLRTLFVVVTVVGCWLGYALHWKSQRQAFLAQPDVFAEFNDTPPSTLNRWYNRLPVFAPAGMWVLGERGAVSVWLPPKIWSPEREAEAGRLFPEAWVMRVDKGKWVFIGAPDAH
jgi:hypothetical protein